MATEESIYEILIDVDSGDLIAYVPASAMAFKLEWGEETEIKPKRRLKLVAQINEDEILKYKKVDDDEVQQIINEGKYAKLIDICKCGHERLDHKGAFNEGECSKCSCKRFTWSHWAIERIKKPSSLDDLRKEWEKDLEVVVEKDINDFKKIVVLKNKDGKYFVHRYWFSLKRGWQVSVDLAEATINELTKFLIEMGGD